MTHSDTVFENCDKIHDQCSTINDIAKAMSRLGIPAADEIFESLNDIRDARHKIERAMSLKLADDFELAQQSSRNVLNATIAGTQLGKEEQD